MADTVGRLRARTGSARGGLSRLVMAVALVAIVVAGCAPPDYVLGPDRPLGCVPRIGTNQIIVPLPGLLLPLPSIRGLSEFDDLPAAPPGIRLPARVDFRDNTQGFNSYAEFALAEGSLYTRPRHSGGLWRKVPTPGCLDGRIVSVSVDSNMAVALDSRGWIYSLDNLLSGPLLWNWTRSYGAPIWLWPGMKVPAEALAPGRWAISHRMTSSFVDAKGYRHPTEAGLVQLVALTGGGSRIVFLDPWLPPDHSYEIGGPVGGRFVAEGISGSGSVTFVMNRYGDMFTRKYDLDLAGANHIPGRYTWQDQGDLPSAPNQWVARVDDFDWAQTRHDVTLVGPSGQAYAVSLYTTDGLRQVRRGPGLDATPRLLEGALDLRGAHQSAELDAFVRSRLGGKKVYEIWVEATLGRLVVRPARFFAQPLGVLRR